MDTARLGRPTWVEIDLDAISQNLAEFRRILGPDISIICCVKANAYGHGLLPVARHLVQVGADILAVGNVAEGVRLRKANVRAPIKVFGNALPEAARAFADYDLMPTFFAPNDPEEYVRVLGPRVPLKVWIKVETGLGRLGVSPEEAVRTVRIVLEETNYDIAGVYTHFGNRAGQKDRTLVELQWQCFMRFLDALELQGIRIRHIQAANGAAVIDMPHTWLNTVSIGLGLYDTVPTEKPELVLNLRRALRALRSKLISVKPFKARSDVGGVQVTRDSLIGVAPIGYGDGYSCRNEGAFVIVRGVRAPTIGKFTQEHLRIDVTDVPGVSVGDQVTLWGTEGDDGISLEEVSNRLGIPVAEVRTSIHHSSVSYIYLKNGEVVDISEP